jgi:starch synthase
MLIVMITPECEHLAKVSGVGDVVAGLSLSLMKKKHDVVIILPRYKGCFGQYKKKETSSIPWGGKGPRKKTYFYEKLLLENVVPVYTIEFDELTNKNGIYSNESIYFNDNFYRFSVFSVAAIDLCLKEGIIPDVFHCHNWPTALVPAYMDHFQYVQHPYRQHFEKTHTLLTIHNIEFPSDQGLFDAKLSDVGLPDSLDFPHEENQNYLHMLKVGIHYADFVNTVSKTFHNETLDTSDPFQLKDCLEKKNTKGKYIGIVNGIDNETWSLEKDGKKEEALKDRSFDIPYYKNHFKQSLLAKYHLAKDKNIPLIGAIGPFKESKNFFLIHHILEKVIEDNTVNFIILGHGNKFLWSKFKKTQETHSDHFFIINKFDELLVREIIAGCDFLLLPSALEPCGLLTMYCQKYGTIPIANATGGFKDTVKDNPSDPITNTGFLFQDCNAFDLINVITNAIKVFHSKPIMERMIENAYTQPFSWEIQTEDYLKVYRELIGSKNASTPPFPVGVPVFISYSHKNKKIAEKIWKRLENERINVRIDEHVIRPGDSVLEEINSLIHSSTYFIALLSKDYFATKENGENFCLLELEYAKNVQRLKTQKFILPIKIEPFDIPDKTLSALLWIDLLKEEDEREFENCIQKLLSVIKDNNNTW